jgi:fucose permease
MWDLRDHERQWSQQDMTSQLGASTTQASLALTAFWAMVTVGRLLFAAIVRWLTARVVYHLRVDIDSSRP